MAKAKQRVRDFSTCPRCGAPTEPSKSYLGNDSEFWLSCTQCNTHINTYIPLPHQFAFHTDPHRYTGNFGGYGTGKTTTSREEFYKHLFITPRGNTLIGANVTSQYEQTIKRDIEGDLPAAFVQDVSVQKSYMDFINGHRLMWRPFDDEGKLRSYNITMFIVVEASEVSSEIYTQLKTRLRNRAATVPKRTKDGKIAKNPKGQEVIAFDWRKGIIESNPDSGWIRSEVLMPSEVIQKHGSVFDQYIQMKDELDPNTSSHIAATDVNDYLPPNFIPEICKNKPNWWINRYTRGSFSYAEGLVYPRAAECVVVPFDISKYWKRIIAFDYGLSDDSVFLFGAIDEEKGILYIYKELRVNNRSVEELAEIYFHGIADIPSGGIWGQPIIDPKSGPKRDYNMKSLGDHFLDYGIAFKPGHVGIEARIYRLNTYIESGKLKIFENCTGLIGELRDYKFPPKKLGVTTSDKPMDKNNHGINPLEWIVMELPADPKNILYGIYNRRGVDLTKQNVNPNRYDPLSSPEWDDSESIYGINYNSFIG